MNRRTAVQLVSAALFGMAAVAPAPAEAQAGDPAVIVTKASRSYKSLSSFQADFKLTLIDKQIGDETQKGTLYQRGPNRFAMRYSDPAKQQYIIDGTYLWMFSADLPDQVTRQPAPSSSVYGVNYIGWLLDNPVERYTMTYVKSENIGGEPADVILLTARSRDMPFRTAEVAFSRVDGLPRRMLFDNAMQKRSIELSRVRPNLTIPDSIFKFNKPANVRIVGPA